MAMLKTHELASPFPVLTGAEMKAIERDIKDNGLLTPIVLFEGKILDGRTRYQAAYHAKVTLTDDDFVQFPGTWDEAMKYVISANLARRHLTESQRAWVANKLAEIPRPGPEQAAHMCARPSSMSQAEAARRLQVSRRVVQHARKVENKGVPELIEAVETGTMKVTPAAKVADLPPAEQRAAVKANTKPPRKSVRAKAPTPAPIAEDPVVGVVACTGELNQRLVAVAGQVGELSPEQQQKLLVEAARWRQMADWVDTLTTGGTVTDEALRALLAGG